jgi:hypothetical protein
VEDKKLANTFEQLHSTIDASMAKLDANSLFLTIIKSRFVA